MLIGHTGRGGVAAVNLANVWRAIPTLGLLVLMVVILGFSPLAWLIPLVVLAIPPILVNTYEGVAGVDPDLKDAARGMGMTQWQVVREWKCRWQSRSSCSACAPPRFSWWPLRRSPPYIGLGGLGRYIIDGLAANNYGEVAGGAAVIVVCSRWPSRSFSLACGALIVPAGLREQGRAS